MGYKLIRSGNTVAQPLQKDFICDQLSDRDDIELEGLSPGATALILASSQVFMLSTEKVWVEL